MAKTFYEENLKRYVDVGNIIDQRGTEIQKSMDRVGARQNELQGYITTIQSTIQFAEVALIGAKTDTDKRKVEISIHKNIELLTKVYDTYGELESIRQRYQQDLTKLTSEKLRLINIDLRRFEDQIAGEQSEDVSTLVGQLRKLAEDISKNSMVKEDIKQSVGLDPKYSMD